MKINNRLNSLSQSAFQNLDEIKENFKVNKEEFYDFGVGDPTLPLREEVILGLENGLKIKNFNNYPPYEGVLELKNELIKYYKKLYNVDLDRDEVIITIGSKNALVNIIPAVCNFNDQIIITDPSYPVYKSICSLWGVNYHKIPITFTNNYLPNLNLDEKFLKESKMILINYPNNPTGAIGNHKFYEEIKKLAHDYNLILVNDGAYNEIVFNDKPISILENSSFNEAVEIGSFSKIFNMTGFRIGYVAGNREVINAILKIKTCLDSGQFIPVQYAALNALKLGEGYRKGVCSEYFLRKEKLTSILDTKNIKYFNPGGGIYLWCEVPKGFTTHEFCCHLLEEYGIITAPGYSFGSAAYGYFRIALTENTSIIEKAFSKLQVYN